MEFKLSQIPNSYRTKHNGIALHSNAEVLILGSSHTLKGINPDDMALPTFNLANVSQTLPYDYAVLKAYFPQLSHLKWVVVPISYFSMYEDLADAESFRPYFYAKEQHVYIPSVDRISFANLSYVGLYGPKLGLQMLLKPQLTEAKGLQPNGFQAMSPAISISAESAKQRLEEHHKYMKKRYWVANKVALDSLISFCTQKHLRLLLVKTPVHFFYSRDERKEFNSPTDSLIIDYNLRYKIPYLDLDNYNQLPDSAFSDPDHLSSVGPKRVTSEISQTLLRLTKQ
jgi:hypothetical protein